MKLSLLILTLLIAACSSTSSHKKNAAFLTPKTSGFIPVNGINMYFETYGKTEGIPLLLLHGGGSTIESNWSALIPLLSNKFRIIAIEEQAHGRTTDRQEGVSFEQTAKDMASFLDAMKITRANVIGFSNGATSAMVLAFRHPKKVNKLIAASALTKRSGAPAGFWKFMQTAHLKNMPKPLQDAFLKVNPDQTKLQNMHDKDAKRMQTFKDIPESELSKITAPTLIMLADQDLISVQHALEHVKTIKGSRLTVLPGNHGDYLGEVFASQKPSSVPMAAAQLIESFLNE